MAKLYYIVFFCLAYLVHTNSAKNLIDELETVDIDDESLRMMYRDSRELKLEEVEMSMKFQKFMEERGSSESWNFCDPGPINCTMNDNFFIKSTNFPNLPPGYPPNIKMEWEFYGDSSVYEIELACPIISTRWSKQCKEDRLAVFWDNGFTQGRRFCGVFVDKKFAKSSPMKVQFRSNNDLLTRMGALCQVSCKPMPTTTTTTSTTTTSTTTTTVTTTFMSGCINEPVCNATKNPVSTCSDIVNLPSSCQCTDCPNHITLYCDICTPCDMEVFVYNEFLVPLSIDLSCVCPENSFTLEDYFCGNNENVQILEFCHNLDYCYGETEFPNLRKEIQKFCTSLACYDTCTEKLTECPTRSLFSAIESHGLQSRNIEPVKIETRTQESVYFSCPEEVTCESCMEEFSLCSETIQANSYDDDGPCLLGSMTFNFPCTKTLEEDFLILGANSVVHTVTLNFNSEKMTSYPSAIAKLFEKAQVIVSFGASSPNCNLCENSWLWDIAEADRNIESSCQDGSGTVSINEYIANNDKPTCD